MYRISMFLSFLKSEFSILNQFILLSVLAPVFLFAKGFPIMSSMPVKDKDGSLNKRKIQKKRKPTKEMSTRTAKKPTMNPPVVNLTSDDEEDEPVADDTTSVLPSASSSSQHSQSTAKRRCFGGPRKKSSVWRFFQ